MLSLRSVFSRFILFGAICCGIVLASPIDAFADWAQLQGTDLMWVTNVAESNFSASSLPSWSSLVSGFPYKPTGSGSIKFASVMCVSGSGIEKGEHFLIDMTDNGSMTIRYGTAGTAGNYTSVTRIPRSFLYYCSQNGSTYSELEQDDLGLFYSDTYKPNYVAVAYTVPNTINSTSYNYYTIVTSPKILLYKNSPNQELEGVVQNQTDQLTDTTGSDTVASDVTSQYSQQVEGLQIFQFVENLDETFKQTLTTQETDSSVVFPGMNLAGFVIPSANVDPLQLVPPDLVTPIKMIVTFCFCSAFVSHIISLLHAIFEIYDYSNTVWYDDERTVGDASVWHLNISG